MDYLNEQDQECPSEQVEVRPCNLCGKTADIELNLNTQDDNNPVWYPICFDCEEKYTSAYEGDEDTYQQYHKEF